MRLKPRNLISIQDGPVFSLILQKSWRTLELLTIILSMSLMEISRPCVGRGAWELYTGEKCQHGMKYLVALFPNGMTALSQQYKGKTNYGRMLNESGWISILQNIAAQPEGKHYVMYWDAWFAISTHIQAPIWPERLSGYIHADSIWYNHLMSQILILIENFFGERANIFSFLIYKNGLKVVGWWVNQIYEVTNFLMNVWTTFHGNLFIHCLGYPNNVITGWRFFGNGRVRMS